MAARCTDAEFREVQRIAATGTLILTESMYRAVSYEYERRGLAMPATLIQNQPIAVNPPSAKARG